MAPRFVSPVAVPYRTTVVQGARPAPQVITQVPVQMPELAPIAPITPTAPVPVFPTDSATLVPQIVEKTIVVQREPPPEVNVNDELDAFYARFAKIQLEKHQLDEALALIQKIKSETFRVRTVVDLAEYVSRDKNYRSEAEQLYRLAIAGMEALDRKQPFRVDSHSAKDALLDIVVPQPQPTESITRVPEIGILQPLVKQEPPKSDPPIVPVKPQPVLIDGEPIQVIPSPPPEPVKSNDPAPKPLIVLPEEDAKQNGRKMLPPPDFHHKTDNHTAHP